MTDDQRSGGRRPSRATGDDLAPVIPLFGGSRSASAQDLGSSDARSLQRDDVRDRSSAVPVGRAFLDVSDVADSSGSFDESVEPVETDEEVRERAEATLLRKLRSRSLSLAEARTVLRGVEGADEIVIEEAIEHFVDLGYLDDAAFADQLVMSAVERRGEGRRAVAETLRKRGIPRDVADAALEALPDDDAERALEFARSKARSVGGKDDEASLRRLAGQLARRGYPSSVALTAARTALREVGIGAGRSRPGPRPMPGVRFSPDE